MFGCAVVLTLTHIEKNRFLGLGNIFKQLFDCLIVKNKRTVYSAMLLGIISTSGHLVSKFCISLQAFAIHAFKHRDRSFDVIINDNVALSFAGTMKSACLLGNISIP